MVVIRRVLVLMTRLTTFREDWAFSDDVSPVLLFLCGRFLLIFQSLCSVLSFCTDNFSFSIFDLSYIDLMFPKVLSWQIIIQCHSYQFV